MPSLPACLQGTTLTPPPLVSASFLGFLIYASVVFHRYRKDTNLSKKIEVHHLG
jgi:hypothetical protein